MSKPRLIFSQNKNETYIFTVNKPNTMKKSKCQQYFHCFTVCILVLYAFQFSYQQNIVTILNSAAFRGAALIRARRLFQCGYPKVRPLFETRCLLEEIGQQKMSRRKLHKTQILQNILILLEVYRSSCSRPLLLELVSENTVVKIISIYIVKMNILIYICFSA